MSLSCTIAQHLLGLGCGMLSRPAIFFFVCDFDLKRPPPKEAIKCTLGHEGWLELDLLHDLAVQHLQDAYLIQQHWLLRQ